MLPELPHKMLTIPPTDLQVWVAQVFGHCGLAPDDAEAAADVLVDTSLRGVDTHGVIWLKNYVDRILKGLINPRPSIQYQSTGLTALQADGDGGLGLSVGVQTMREAIRRAAQHGLAVVAVRNSSHFGAAGYYARMASAQHMIGFAFSNGGPAMAPWGSITPYLGTNPMAFAAPGGLEGDVALDMATSQVASGKVSLALLAGRQIPAGWATDALGRPTDDPATALAGLMLPLGGYKGYGLALMVETLCGVLTGAAIGPHLVSDPSDGRVAHNVGHFFMALDIQSFMPVAQFQERMQQMLAEIHGTRLAPDAERIYVPGEIERETAIRRQRDGIPCPEHLVADLKEVGHMAGEPFRW